jgi:hypothetical protein
MEKKRFENSVKNGNRVSLPPMKKKGIFLIIMLLVASGNIFAQEPDEDGPRGRSGPGANQEQKRSAEKSDTVKLYQRSWTIGADPTVFRKAGFDTIINEFQHYSHQSKVCFASSFNGNVGLAGKPLFYPYQPHNDDFIFNNAYDAYLLTPERLRYYNTNKPYTVLNYATATRKRDDQMLGVIHSQNFTPFFNVALRYNGLNSKGEYSRQQTKNNSVGISATFDGKRYYANAVFIRNKFVTQENGGIVVDSASSNSKNSNLPAKLLNASSYMLNRTYQLTQSFTLKKIAPNDSIVDLKPKPSVTISHIFDYTLASTVYKDVTDDKSTFYSGFYYNKSGSLDTVAFRMISNSVQLKFNEDWNSKFKIGMRFMLTNELRRFYNFRSYLIADNDSDLTSYSATASLFNNKGHRWNWQANAKYYVQGYKSGDFVLWGELTKSFVSQNDSAIVGISGSMSKTSPGFFENRYFSNHFRWLNDFKDKNELLVQFKFDKPAWGVKLVASYSIIDNYIYFNDKALPDQTSKPLSVLSVDIQKNLKFWFLHFDNHLLYQAISNTDVMPLPQVSLNSSFYAQFFAFKVLHGQIGFDAYYYTSYNLPAYMPATKQFYLQTDAKIDTQYPFVDFFANLKIKRALLFFKFENLNSMVFGKKYYFVAGQPLNSTAFKFGISWRFFD